MERYGEIKDVFLDGAKGEGEKDMEYFFHTWFSLIHQHQPAAIIFSDAGPDTRWVGNELGLGASTYMRPREIRLVMSGYLPSVMSQSDL
ncbi:hypothetical protein HN51_041473, partial [Arachis hypogaea]